MYGARKATTCGGAQFWGDQALFDQALQLFRACVSLDGLGSFQMWKHLKVHDPSRESLTQPTVTV